MAADDYDLFVIGGGSGGVRAARIAAGHGARVGIAEAFRFGGTCVIRGCVPKKLMVYASRFADEFADATGFGWQLQQPTFDWATLIANKDREIARLEGIYAGNLEKAGVVLHRSHASIAAPQTVRLADGRTIRAGKILIATGGAPKNDDRFAVGGAIISSNELFELPTLPPRIVVVGGGYIAVEFACLLHGLGAEVTLVHRSDELLRHFDKDLRQHLREAMQARGIRIVLGQGVRGIEQNAAGSMAHVTLDDGSRHSAERVLFAIGRQPNTVGLGLEALGIALGRNGSIPVDGYSRTSAPGVFAVGDVTDRVNLTPVAIREGHAFADTEFGGKPTAFDHALIPTAVFTTPELGTVGLSEEQAREAHANVDIYRANFRPLKATLSGRAERELMKLIVDADSDKVLGAHMIGHDAGEMMQLLAIAIRMGATKRDLDATLAVHPTAAEEWVTMGKPAQQHRR
ncbi:MAG TPA: glutathione-disulfide reductase [Fontimonas sp.]